MDSEVLSFPLLERLLNHTKVANIKEYDQLKSLVLLSKDDTVTYAMEVLAANAITSAPVYDADRDVFLGFVDTLDLTMFIVKMFAENFEKHPHLYDPKELKKRFELPVSEVMNASNRDPFVVVEASASLHSLINDLRKFGSHRVAMKSGQSMVGVVSQSDIIRFLAKHTLEIASLRRKRLSDLGLDRGSVVSVTNAEPLMKAFTTILHHKITGLCVTDLQTGEIVNNVSASDLKGVTQATFYKLEAPIHQVLLYGHKLAPVVCSMNSNFGEVLDLFTSTGVHRVYVVDKDRKPVNVITLTDMLKVVVDAADHQI